MSPEVSTDTVAVVHPDSPDGRTRMRHRRLFSWLTFALLFAVISSAVIDGTDLVDVWGVDTSSVMATASDGTTLEVTYATVTRPALASPFEIEVRRPGGFDGEVELRVNVSYLALWDLNGITPSPAGEHSDGDQVIWTFDPPEGEVLRVSYDARIEPGAQLDRRRGVVSLLDGGESSATVRFVTRVRP